MELGTNAQWWVVGLVGVAICGLVWWTDWHLDVDLEPEPPESVVDNELVDSVGLLRDDVGLLTTKVDELAKDLRAREGSQGLLETIDSIQLGAVRFDKGSDVIKPADNRGLAEMASGLAENSRAILVVGLADSCGRPTWNLNLSERRAQAVADWFRDWGSVPAASEIYVRGMGESLGVFGAFECDDERLRGARVIPLDSEAGRRVFAAVSGRSASAPVDE